MGDSYTCLLTHFAWSTRNREPQITKDLGPCLHAYIAGILKQLDCPPILINGVEDHVHVLTHRHPTKAEAELARVMKANASKWVHDEFPRRRTFAWQHGYAAFSVSMSRKDAVQRYIANQEEHHRKLSWHEEIELLYKKHKIPFDPQYLD